MAEVASGPPISYLQEPSSADQPLLVACTTLATLPEDQTKTQKKLLELCGPKHSHQPVTNGNSWINTPALLAHTSEACAQPWPLQLPEELSSTAHGGKAQ